MTIKTSVKIPNVDDNGMIGTDAIADGAITGDKLASGVGGGVWNYADLKYTWAKGTMSKRYKSFKLADGIYLSFYSALNNTYTEDVNVYYKILYSRIDFNNFYCFLLHTFIPLYSDASITESFATPYWVVSSANLTGLELYDEESIALVGSSSRRVQEIITGSTSDWIIRNGESDKAFPFNATDYTSSGHLYCSFYVPKSTSAQAALAELLPVQDEVETLESEINELQAGSVTTMSIDNAGNDITSDEKTTALLENKISELEEKQAELDKLREDYFSKLGDWRNE